MKPPPFTYHRPETLDEALTLLAELGPEGKVLAGGQSLVPVLNMRLAAPHHLVDVNRLTELAYVHAEPDAVRVGALARHADVAADLDAEAAAPLLRQATLHVAHPAIRNRGTTVGSLVHADPAAEMPAVLALLDGFVEVRSATRTRTVRAADFFVGPMESAVQPGELATHATFWRQAGRTGTAWHELSRRHGDYALAGVGVLVTLDDDLRVVRVRAACTGVGPGPVVVDLTDPVHGRSVAAADWAATGRLAAEAVEPDDDIHASAAYRKELVGVLAERALTDAAANAVRGSAI